MQYITVTNVLAALAVFGIASAAPGVALSVTGKTGGVQARVNSGGPNPNFPFPVATNLTWTGPSKGVTTTLYGSLQEIKSQLQVLDPDWKPVTPPAHVERGLKARQGPVASCCPIASWGWVDGNLNDLHIASDSLTDLGNEIGGFLGVNPQTCYAAYCVAGTGIWACNQNTDAYLEISTNQISKYATDYIGVTCDYNVCGQVFDGTGWNTIVHGQGC